MEKLSSFFRCMNYYAGKMGTNLVNLDGSTLSDDDKTRLFIADENEIFVSPMLVPKLILVKAAFERLGIGLIIKDGFRSLELYQMIINARRKEGKQVEGLISTDCFPHATGLAVDVTLYNLETGVDIWNRDEKKDGPGSRYMNFYKNATDKAGREFHRIQTVMFETFGQYGIVSGSKKEVWHVELEGIDEKTPRY